VTRYRIKPWPIRILIPIAALALIAGIVHDGDAPAVLIPLVAFAATAYLYAGEGIGLYCSPGGLESRMTRRHNSFRYQWAEIERFEIVEAGALLAIVIHLRDGSQRVLPSTKGWRSQRAWLAETCTELNRRARAAG
jgi:hypothetical protein